ncbi:unnamed protein product [Peronospora effusa]|nr:unnamed protein product [Peronospora effusa]
MFGLIFSRWYLLVAVFAIQFCLGCIYAWSVLNHPIDMAIYGDAETGHAVNTFYIALGVSGTAAAALGPIIERKGPQWAVFIGTTLFLTGQIVTGIGCHYKSIAWIYIGYGVVSSIGMAMCYVSPLSTLQKWFPDYRGTVAGFAVAGSGAGSIVLSKAYLPIIDAVGLPWMFVVTGFIMSIPMYATLLVLRVPQADFTVNGLDIYGDSVHENGALDKTPNDGFNIVQTPVANDAAHYDVGSSSSPTKLLTLKQAILTPEFTFIYIMFFANQLFGIIVLSRLSGMCTDIFNKSPSTASDIVSIISASNCGGRLVFASISDLLVRKLRMEKAFSRKVLYYFTLGTQIIVIGSLPTVIRHKSFTYFVVEMFVLTNSYGGGLATIPALVTDMYGPYHVGPMQGILLTSLSFGAIVGGITFNHSLNEKVADGKAVGEAYIDNLKAIFVIVSIGFAILFLVRTNVTDRFEPGYHFSLCGKRVISIPPTEKSEARRAEAKAEAEIASVECASAVVYTELKE